MREVTRVVAYIADGPIDIQAELAALQAKRDAIRNRICLVPWKFYPRTLFFKYPWFLSCQQSIHDR